MKLKFRKDGPFVQRQTANGGTILVLPQFHTSIIYWKRMENGVTETSDGLQLSSSLEKPLKLVWVLAISAVSWQEEECCCMKGLG